MKSVVTLKLNSKWVLIQSGYKFFSRLKLVFRLSIITTQKVSVCNRKLQWLVWTLRFQLIQKNSKQATNICILSPKILLPNTTSMTKFSLHARSNPSSKIIPVKNTFKSTSLRKDCTRKSRRPKRKSFQRKTQLARKTLMKLN